MNMARLNTSAARLNFPAVDGVQFLECMKRLLAIDKSWIPRADGYSLYLRPTYIATHPFLGVSASQKVKLFTILSPVGPYYPEGFAPVKLFADNKFVRAWPGGTGDTKLGPNYAGTILPQSLAAKKGYSQVMWLFGDEVTEVGTMNIFFLWVNKHGKKELVTAPLDGTILPGVTRNSIIELAKQWGEFDVVERKFTIHEVVDAIKENRMIEAFGAGTAAIVSPVQLIHFAGTDYKVSESNSTNLRIRQQSLQCHLSFFKQCISHYVIVCRIARAGTTEQGRRERQGGCIHAARVERDHRHSVRPQGVSRLERGH